MPAPSKDQVHAGFLEAKRVRSPKESRFDQALRYSMPGRGSFFGNTDNDSQIDDVFDETAIVAVQEFASRLQSGITPNFSRWAQLMAGTAIPEDEQDEVNADLDAVNQTVFEIISQSNFASESYEGYLDLAITLGALEIEKGTAVEPVRFNAIPVTELYVNNGPFDRLDQFYRVRAYTADAFVTKYPKHTMPADKLTEWRSKGGRYNFVDAVTRDWSDPNEECHYRTLLCKECDMDVVFSTEYKGVGSCPIIAFRWGKESGSVWGRGPLMNALPAIKTVNLVVQMVLENAQMHIGGIYNMDDDGIVNVDTIQLVPGTVVPRTPGSRGLEAVQPAGNFNVADLVLREQRDNIKRALYNDMLGNPNKTPMSATEVAERMADLARQIGAAFGRLMAELVQPVIQRVVFILKELGIVKMPTVNGREIRVVATSPLANAQAQEDVSNIDRFIAFIQQRFGPQLVNVFIKGEETAALVGKKLQIPPVIIRTPTEIKGLAELVSQQGGMVPGETGSAMPDLAGGAPVA